MYLFALGLFFLVWAQIREILCYNIQGHFRLVVLNSLLLTSCAATERDQLNRNMIFPTYFNLAIFDLKRLSVNEERQDNVHKTKSPISQFKVSEEFTVSVCIHASQLSLKL